MQQTRRLAAILFTDIVGYTAMMQKDEQHAVSINQRYEIILKQFVLSHGGEILNDYGDGSLCSFSSATEAIRCSIEMQQEFQMEPKVPLRIGLHIGEIFFEDGKVLGDGVNIASRIQSLGQSNTILFSKEIFDKLRNQSEFKSVSLGSFELKNVDEPMQVYALSNEGLNVPNRNTMEGKLKTEIIENKKRVLKRKRKILLLLILATVAGIIYFQFISVRLTSVGKSIALLPFTVIGSDENHLGDGLIDDILVHLSKIKELKVISNKTSSRYNNTNKSFKEIGEELKVTTLMTGSIQQKGDSIRIIAQLIDTKSENTLWAEDYIREIKEVFDLEAEVATKIVIALKTKLTQEEQRDLTKRYTENPEAYKYYSKGRSFWLINNFDSAESYYRQAIQSDPQYAQAYAALAECYAVRRKGLTQSDAMNIANTYAVKALSLDNNLSDAYTILGFIQQNFLYEWAESKRTLKKAIDLDPNYSFAHFYYGNLLQFTGDEKEGLNEVKKALELDPLSSRINWALGRNY
jgi:TolB-like protein/class 3 adenylate cyclase